MFLRLISKVRLKEAVGSEITIEGAVVYRVGSHRVASIFIISCFSGGDSMASCVSETDAHPLYLVVFRALNSVAASYEEVNSKRSFAIARDVHSFA